jgi:hypothetical protein
MPLHGVGVWDTVSGSFLGESVRIAETFRDGRFRFQREPQRAEKVSDADD